MFSVFPMPPRGLAEWYRLKDSIDFSPQYQRAGNIWTLDQKSLLIDSVLNGFDIPKFYFADFAAGENPLNAQKRRYAVIDGKQRLLAIFDFFEDKFPLSDTVHLDEFPDSHVAGMTFSKIKERFPKVVKKIEEFTISAMGVLTSDEAKINELFVRLNSSKPLSGAEIRNAMKGVVPDAVRRLSEEAFFRDKIRFAVNRGGHRNAAAKLLLLEYVGSFVDVKRKHLDTFVEEAQAVQSSAIAVERAADRCRGVLARMTAVFHDRDPLLSRQGEVPVLYWLVRTLDVGVLKDLHRALESFNNERERLRVDPNASASPYVKSFQLASRNVNDHSSMKAMYLALDAYVGESLGTLEKNN